MKDERHSTQRLGKMKSKMIMASLLAILMVVTVVPMTYSEDSDALTGDLNLSLNAKHVILYKDTTDQNSFDFEVYMDDCTSEATSVTWTVNVIGSPSATLSFSNVDDTTVTVTGTAVGTIELIAYADEDNYASAVVVVMDSPETPASTFWFYIKAEISTNDSYYADLVLPANLTLAQLNGGYWIYATASEVAAMYGSDTPFNAMNALMCAVAKENATIQNGNLWTYDISAYGWVNSFLGLETYHDNTYTIWTYWSQFHASSGDVNWTFNNYGLYDITTEEYTYMGMIFRTSYSESDVVPFPGVPTP